MTKNVINAELATAKNEMKSAFKQAIDIFTKYSKKVENARNEEELIGIGVKLNQELTAARQGQPNNG